MKVDTSGVDLLNATNSKLKTFNKATWIDWTTPTLGGSLPLGPVRLGRLIRGEAPV